MDEEKKTKRREKKNSFSSISIWSLKSVDKWAHFLSTGGSFPNKSLCICIYTHTHVENGYLSQAVSSSKWRDKKWTVVIWNINTSIHHSSINLMLSLDCCLRCPSFSSSSNYYSTIKQAANSHWFQLNISAISLSHYQHDIPITKEEEEEDLWENTNHRTLSCYHLLLIFQVNAPYMSISMLEQSLQVGDSRTKHHECWWSFDLIRENEERKKRQMNVSLKYTKKKTSVRCVI